MNLQIDEVRLKAVFKGIPVPSYIWQQVGEDFVLIDFNTAAEVYTEGTITEFRGARFSQMYRDFKEKQQIENNFIKCINERTTIITEMTYPMISTGKNRELRVYYVFVTPDLVLVHTQDITDDIQSDKKLRELSNAIEVTADSVVITDKRGIIQYVNPAFEKNTGFSRTEVIGNTPRVVKSGMHDKLFYKKLWKTILSGNTFSGTIINKKKDGEIYWSQQTITPMKNESGDITNFVSVLTDITALREQQEQEFRMNIAHELQKKFYKLEFPVQGFDISGKTYSAEKTCGDYYDFIMMHDGSIGLIIGDVCGHGIGAALIMAETRALIRAFSKLETDIGLILTQVNQELFNDLDDTHYVTLTFARIDTKNNFLEYVNAGHVPSYVLGKTGEKEHILESTGIPLGVLQEYTYQKSHPVKLSPGDILTFITDGITETMTSNAEEFGIERTLKIIKENRNESSLKIIEKLYKEVRAFAKKRPQEDDISCIICKTNSVS